MAHCKVPVSKPQHRPPINYNSDLFGAKPSLNTDYNFDVQGGQYPYVEQDHLALSHLAFKNFIRPRTLDGKTVLKPVNEEQFGCECNLARTPLTSKYNNEALKFEVKSGVIKRGCDCIKRNGLQDRCSRVRHENRWECFIGKPHGCTSGLAKPRSHYANHLQRPARSPYSNPCGSTSRLQGIGRSMTDSLRQLRHTKVLPPRCVRSQVLGNLRSITGVKGSEIKPSMSQQSNRCLSKSTNKSTNIVCCCQTC